MISGAPTRRSVPWRNARALDEEIRQETRKITEQFSAASAMERLSLAPKRGQVSVQLVGLGWLPEDRG